MNENHKVVKIKNCSKKLLFVKAIKENCHKALEDAKNIVDSIIRYNKETNTYDYGVLLLNESSITVQQWEKITKVVGDSLEWEYV